MSVQFENNTMEVSKDIAEAVESFLTEVGGELQAATMRNSRVDTGQTRGSYEYDVSDTGDEVTVAVGSNMENAIWEEYGTGEYALEGGGRQGGWVYQDQRGEFHHTHGKSPNRPLFRAFDAEQGKIETELANRLKGV